MEVLDFHVEYAGLPAVARQEADRWHNAFLGLVPPVVQGLQRIANAFNVSFGTARERYYAWKRNPSPLALVDNRRRELRKQSLPPEFIEWWKALVERHQRKTKPAFRRFCEAYYSGLDIPGLPPAHEARRVALPAGCSYKNLLRYQPTATERAAARIGRAAAKSLLPQVLTTRVGLWPGAHYMIDDLWHDNFVAFRGKLCRVMELNAIDVFSGCKIGWGCKPRLTNEDGSQQGLQEKYARLLVAQILWEHGYSAKGTVFFAEHGTAAISEHIEQLLHDRGLPITVRRSGIMGEEQVVLADFAGKGKGNFRFKAPLESLHNLIHNQLDHLPAQTGMDIEHRPESLTGSRAVLRKDGSVKQPGLLAYAADLLRAMQTLAPERAALLQLPVWDYHGQFLPFLASTYDQINARGELPWFSHALEGWRECGHVALEYRLSPNSDQWIGPEEIAAMPPEARAFFPLLAKNPECLRERLLSPREVWRRRDLVRAPSYLIAEILGPDFAREEKVKQHGFTFQDYDLHPEPLRYEARVTTPEGDERELAEDTYQLFINPFSLGSVFVHDARGRFLGTARRETRVSRALPEAVAHRAGAVAKREREIFSGQRERQTQRVAEIISAREHNADVLAGTTPEDRREAAEREQLTRAAEDALMNLPD